MKKRPRKLYAALGVTAGIVLAAFEYSPALAGNGEDIFWLIIAGLLILFGLAEAFSPQ
ncbi:MAG TPA: hypothetical protein VFE58_19245 [Tepidisphaeraceae bacterium]|jgi:hypothetical protein|nr:hypothetical protein [Tepidisphaeraceae bacterium]